MFFSHPPGALGTARLFQEDNKAYLTWNSLWGTQQNSLLTGHPCMGKPGPSLEEQTQRIWMSVLYQVHRTRTRTISGHIKCKQPILKIVTMVEKERK